MAKCSTCGSDEVKEFSAEFDFARPNTPAVYAVLKVNVCLECGFSVCFAPPDILTRLQMDPAARCGMCGSNELRAYNAKIAFGRGLAPPVHMVEEPLVRICLECGFSMFSVPENPLVQLREGRPPQSLRPVSDPLPRRKKSA